MSKPVIRVEGLSKLYKIGAARVRHDTLRDQIVDFFKSVRPRRGVVRAADRSFWALKDVSFDVRQGEIVGVIGRNGAGKSTLLKVLSRITRPTKGRGAVYGRIGSLLEVGTGFHPELTGRENIYLNGAILGMKRDEIARRFDEIVAFSEVGKFLDTPVKHFSSGMYVRLAFAVAAHLEPEILLIDEVLAVGDASFQKKCIGKIGEVARSGRTVLVVSHNMAVVCSLCSRAILLQQGQVVNDGPTEAVVAGYVRMDAGVPGETCWESGDTCAGNGRLRLLKARIVSKGRTAANVEIDESFVLEFDFEVQMEKMNVCSSIHVFDRHAVCAFVAGTRTRPLTSGIYRHSYTFPAELMNDGTYSVTILLLSDTDRREIVMENAISFTVHETRARTEFLGMIIGCVRPRLEINEIPLMQPMVNSL